MPGRRRWWTGRRLEVGGPLQDAASIYLGLSLLGRTHGVVWHALGGEGVGSGPVV